MQPMQRIQTFPGNSHILASGTARRPFGRGLIVAMLIAGTLPLAGCEGFPWDKKQPAPVEEAAVYSGPSVTRGRPPAPPPSPQAKPKPKKKPAAPTPAETPDQTGGGPQAAAEPGQPTPAASPDQAVSTDGAPGDTTQSNGDQVASLPGGQLDHVAGSRPDDMIGRDENGIRALIGAPAKMRTEGSTTVWSYEKDGCSLDLFLFYDVKTGAQRVLSYEIKPNATDTDAIQACYNKFHNNV